MTALKRDKRTKLKDGLGKVLKKEKVDNTAMSKVKKEVVEVTKKELDAAIVADVIETAKEQPISDINAEIPLETDRMVSTGSTLLDLIISGSRIRGGGIPAGILCEFFGPSGCGKTAILSEIAASTQIRGGSVLYADPEARLDKNYAQTFGLNIGADEYSRPDTVSELFETLWGWQPKNPNAINTIASDSLAALSTDLEMESADKMGMRRAKEFSEGLRKTCRLIKNNGYIIACSNQLRQGTNGTSTPGGNAVPFYSSLRVSMWPGAKVEVTKALPSGKKEPRIIGVSATCTTVKSSIDNPFRTCPIYVIFNHGIDDIRANLQWRKEIRGDTKYDVFDKSYVAMNAAIKFIEANDYEDKLREDTIDLWEDVEKRFVISRKAKKRR